MTEVTVANAHPRKRVAGAALVRLLRSVLAGEKTRHAKLCLVLIDRHRCRRINERFLGHPYETDVLSFPLESTPRLEGEVYVNLDRAATQARDYGVTFGNEVARLAVHGTLHLLGYDDRRAADSRRMKNVEERYVALAQRAGKTP
jgi:rRNA maturation RNase YbeY